MFLILCLIIRADEYNQDLLDDKKWVDEYSATDDGELAKTANELLGSVNDPKLTESEVSYLGMMYLLLLLEAAHEDDKTHQGALLCMEGVF